jgi:hypothetical protein
LANETSGFNKLLFKSTNEAAARIRGKELSEIFGLEIRHKE